PLRELPRVQHPVAAVSGFHGRRSGQAPGARGGAARWTLPGRKHDERCVDVTDSKREADRPTLEALKTAVAASESGAATVRDVLVVFGEDPDSRSPKGRVVQALLRIEYRGDSVDVSANGER